MSDEPIAAKADRFVRELLADVRDMDDARCVYQILLLGAVGALKQRGLPVSHIARLLQAYAIRLLSPEGLVG